MAVPTTTFNLAPATGLAGEAAAFSLPNIVQAAIILILVVAAIVFFFILLIGGIQWLTSGGDKAKTEAARNRITAALVGLVIVFAAWAILNLVATFFGLDILGQLEIPNVVNP